MRHIIVIISTFIFCLGYMHSANAQFTETREYNKRFKVAKETQIEILNKYGNIEVNTWDKDSVTIDINLRVEEKKLSKLEKRMEEIDFDFTNSQRFLIAKTVLKTSSSTLEKEIRKFTESILQTDGNMEIDYIVWMPKGNNLKVENKFGNIILNELKGDVDISLENGNLKVHKLEGKTNINLSFADATINHMKDARITSNYSEWYLKFCEDLTIESKQSDFEILEMKDLIADSRRDKFRIRLASLIDVTGSFSSFRVNELDDKVNLRLSHGDVSLEEINPEFSNIFIESRNTDLDLYFDDSSNFSFEIVNTKASLNLARSITVDKEEIMDDKTGKIKIKASMGKSKTSNEKLFINAEGGEINIMKN